MSSIQDIEQVPKNMIHDNRVCYSNLALSLINDTIIIANKYNNVSLEEQNSVPDNISESHKIL